MHTPHPKIAKKHDYSGIICGHIHQASVITIDEILYVKCGDWVESSTAVVEDQTGNLEIFEFS